MKTTQLNLARAMMVTAMLTGASVAFGADSVNPSSGSTVQTQPSQSVVKKHIHKNKKSKGVVKETKSTEKDVGVPVQKMKSTSTSEQHSCKQPKKKSGGSSVV